MDNPREGIDNARREMKYVSKVAIIGCGLIGQKRAGALPTGTVTVACDLDLQRAQKIAAQHPGCVATDSIEQTLKATNVDSVMVATLNADLGSIGIQAAEA